MAFGDTSARAQQLYVERLRATPPRERLARAFKLSEQARNATMSDLRRRNPGLSERELAIAFVERVYGRRLAERLARTLR